MATRQMYVNGKWVAVNVPANLNAIASAAAQSPYTGECPKGTVYSKLALGCVPIGKGKGDTKNLLLVSLKSGVLFTDADIKGMLVYKAYNNPSVLKKLLADQGLSLQEGLTIEDFTKAIVDLYLDPATRVKVLQAGESTPYDPAANNWTTTAEARTIIENFEEKFNTKPS